MNLKSGSARQIGRRREQETPRDPGGLTHTLVPRGEGCFVGPYRSSGEPVLGSQTTRGPPSTGGLWSVLVLGTPFWRDIILGVDSIGRYLTSAHPAWDLPFAAAAPIVMILMELRVQFLGGWLSRSSGWGRRSLAGGMVLAAAIPLSIPILGVGEALALLAILGFLAGVLAALTYILPCYLPPPSPRCSHPKRDP